MYDVYSCIILLVVIIANLLLAIRFERRLKLFSVAFGLLGLVVALFVPLGFDFLVMVWVRLLVVISSVVCLFQVYRVTRRGVRV